MITLEDVKSAQARIAGVAVSTPLVHYTDFFTDRQTFPKPESFQPVGAFKLRGAYNKIATLSPDQRRQGVIAFSSGNHAQGVAYAARAMGIRAVIVMPAQAPAIKRAKTLDLGAEIVTVEKGGEEEWRVAAETLAAERGLAMVPPFDDETIIAGQATVGLEILQDLPEVELVLVPIGGGGLISGVAAALKLSRPDIKVVGVEPEWANDAQASLRSGRIVELPIEQTGRTIADGMRATRIGDITFEHIRTFVDDIITVSEEEIRKALRKLILDARLVVEPSGAVTFAAFLYHQHELPPARRSVTVISGGNVDPELLAQILAEKG
jgi:threonine dehydratase